MKNDPACSSVSDMAENIRNEQVQQIYSLPGIMILANIPLAIFTAYTLHDAVPAGMVNIWLVCVTVITLVLALITLRYQHSARQSEKYWGWSYIVITAVLGASWGYTSLFLFYDLSQHQENYIILLLLGLSAIAIAINRTLLHTFIAFVVPCLLPFSFVLVFSSIAQPELAVLILFYLVVIIHAAYMITDNTRKNIEYRLSNNVLINELSRSNSTLTTEVNEREKIQKSLYQSNITAEKTKQEAQRANRAKSEFLSRMSHELRTPLNAILGFSQLLEREPDLAPQHRSDIKNIYDSGQHLLELINEVLDLSHIDSGRLSISLETIVLTELLHECCSIVSSLADDMQITIHTDFQFTCDTKVIADHIRLRQVVLNLLSNAIKYNHKGGDIWLNGESLGETVHIEIRDNGYGIPESKQSQLFQPFNRLGAEHSEIEGTGIGLVITRRLVELMDGRIGFSSEENQGTTFWVKLNKDNASAVSLAHDNSELDELFKYPLPYFKLLYVEDNKNNLKMITQLLSKISQAECIYTPTAELGLVLARTYQPDIILMDINLPGMDGYSALKILKDDPQLISIPVIALSANAMPRDLNKGRQAGFHAYLTKPVDFVDIANAIRSALLHKNIPLSYVGQ